MAKISVVVPTHNRRDLLQRAVESAQAQTYADIEIIVVSDGSTDGTKEAVEVVAADDSRIRFIELSPARGGNAARNAGIEAATGDYVAFLDDDDKWLPEKLEKQMKVMQADPTLGLVYTGVRILYVNEGVAYNSKARDAGDMRQKILLENYIGTTSTVLVKKDLLREAGMFDVELKALQDYDLWIRICQRCNIGVVSEELIEYYNYTGSKQVSASTQKYIDAFARINEKYREFFAALPAKLRKQKRINELWLLTNKALRNGDGKAARKYAKEAFKMGGGKKALIFYALSFLSYKTVLKLRSRA